ENLIHHPHREIVRVVAADAEPNQADITLIHIVFFREIDSRFGTGYRNLRRSVGSAFGQRAKCLAPPIFHFLRVEVAHYSEDDVVGSKMAFVPIHEILAGDRGNRPVLSMAAVRTVGPVAQHGSLASGNALDFIIAARNSRSDAPLGELNFVLTKYR